MAKRLKVGIVGQGRSGRNIHGAHLVRDTDRFEIAGVADVLEDRRRRAAEEYGCAVYADYRELLRRRDLDLVVNSTMSFMHPNVTLAAIRARHNVLCEKPMAARVRDVDRMIAASRKTGKVLAVFQQSRFSPAFRKIREIIASGKLGRIVQITMDYNGFSRRWDWQTLQSHGGGNLMNTGPHPLDQAMVLFGDGMPKVTCFMDRTDNTAGDAEDYVKLLMSGPGRPTIDLEISSVCAYSSPTYNLQGTRGGLKGSASALEWKYYAPSELAPIALTTAPISKPDGTPCYCGGTIPWREESWTFQAPPIPAPARPGPQASSDLFETMAASFYSMLYKTLTEGAPLEVTPEQVRRQVAVFELCRKQNPNVYPPKRRAANPDTP